MFRSTDPPDESWQRVSASAEVSILRRVEKTELQGGQHVDRDIVHQHMMKDAAKEIFTF
jgi:hypothetical protein